jgi:hypothetical protein
MNVRERRQDWPKRLHGSCKETSGRLLEVRDPLEGFRIVKIQRLCKSLFQNLHRRCRRLLPLLHAAAAKSDPQKDSANSLITAIASPRQIISIHSNLYADLCFVEC